MLPDCAEIPDGKTTGSPILLVQAVDAAGMQKLLPARADVEPAVGMGLLLPKPPWSLLSYSAEQARSYIGQPMGCLPGVSSLPFITPTLSGF